LQIEVGTTPLVTPAGTYYRVTGYAPDPLWVRRASDGVYYWLNERTNREETLADFRGGRFPTPVSGSCEQSGEAQKLEVAYEAGGNVFSATEVRYRVYNCADTGVDSELWVENVGMVQRVNTTIIGPRAFRLVSAKVGGLTFSETPGVSFLLSLPASQFNRRSANETIDTEVALRLEVDRLQPVRLRFPTSQRYDISVKDDAGKVVYLWSSLAIFLPAIGEEEFVSKEYRVPVSLAIPDGRYLLEAWLTTETTRMYSAASTLTVVTASR